MKPTALTAKSKTMPLLIPAIFLIQSCAVRSPTTTAAPDDHSPPASALAITESERANTSKPPSPLEKYNNERYVIFGIDIDGDGAPDKAVSSAPNRGDELIFFLQDHNDLVESLTSINFSEDGGRILDTIGDRHTNLHHRAGEVAFIRTFYPKEENSATYYIAFINNEWRLKRVIYNVSDWREDGGRRYSCQFAYNIPMQTLTTESWGSKIWQAPEAPKSAEECVMTTVHLENTL